MDIDVFLKNYMNHIKYAEDNDGYEIAFPFKLYNDDHISSCHIKEESTGLFIVSDNGNVFKYFENNGINLNAYQKQVNKICDMFDLYIEDGYVKKVLGEYETNQTFVQLTNFFIGISHLATMNRFD
ncbi:MAG: hypothetical protein K2K50_03395 [Anaeroplasmataceae bacterium]|nr:hypothetical protein [Anaeroplasmataceae bacterium]